MFCWFLLVVAIVAGYSVDWQEVSKRDVERVKRRQQIARKRMLDYQMARPSYRPCGARDNARR